MSEYTSRALLAKILVPKQISPGYQEYLENQILNLENMAEQFRVSSELVSASPRSRGRSRDLEKSCRGLINGIKFGISIMQRESTMTFAEFDKEMHSGVTDE